ncbi:unnamed protein product [Sphagnum jensenii]|uniref:Charged multivesicular body protein 7 n=1 Tax=Sphagnum jensenii TaxID=128206 RepID=A0ABP1B1P8_9BRYO
MAEESHVAAFLEAEVPDWGDEVISRARYKAFTGQRADYEARLQFWKTLVVKCARHLNLVVIDANMVQQKWYLREGVTPLGIATVLKEMHKSGELKTKEELLSSQQSLVQYTGSLLKQLFVWAGRQVLSTSSPHEHDAALADKLIVTSLLQERKKLVIESLTENQWAKGCIVTMANFQELCGGAETADIIKLVLVLEGKAHEIKVVGRDNIEGLKISLKENLVTAVSENDCHILQLHWTMERLQQQYSILEQRVTISRASTVRAIKAGDKQAALRHARRWKTLNSSKEQCGNFMDRIDEVLTSIADAEATQKVTDAVKVGASAIKEHHVTLDEVHTCLEELNQAISEQKETQEALGAPSATDEEDADLEKEFDDLEADIEAESLADIERLPEPPRQERISITNDTSITERPDMPAKGSVPEKHLEDDDKKALEKAFANLELELA